jgi:hypothetical protein
MRHVMVSGWLIFAAALCGCGSSGDGKPADDGSSGALNGSVSCVSDARVEPYVAGMSQLGKSGVLTFQLVSNTPAPPAVGGNRLEVAVTDADGASPPGDLRINLFMPDHGHGASAVPIVTYDAASAIYAIEPADYFMAGVWRVQLGLYESADEAAKLVDQATFFFCVQG